MILFRRAVNADLESIHKLAKHSGIGMTTLPKDKNLLKKRLHWSSHSFKKELHQPSEEYYLFVLEDQETQKIIGTSAIESKIGQTSPFYSYKVSKRTRICNSLNIRSEYDVLSLVNDNQGHSEICTLFLEPEHRAKNNGLLLSKARFLFMAQHPKRFAPIVIAEMRGISDEHGRSPFWDNIGSHFFQMPFSEADRLTLATDKQFIADLMPRNPIYIALLSKEAQSVIGKPHASTAPALKILFKEGFRYNNYVDIFDGGPTIECPIDEIKTLARSHLVSIEGIEDEISGPTFLLSNTLLNFRATVAHIELQEKSHSCYINKETAKLLKVKKGDYIRMAPITQK